MGPTRWESRLEAFSGAVSRLPTPALGRSATSRKRVWRLGCEHALFRSRVSSRTCLLTAPTPPAPAPSPSSSDSRPPSTSLCAVPLSSYLPPPLPLWPQKLLPGEGLLQPQGSASRGVLAPYLVTWFRWGRRWEGLHVAGDGLRGSAQRPLEGQGQDHTPSRCYRNWFCPFCDTFHITLNTHPHHTRPSFPTTRNLLPQFFQVWDKDRRRPEDRDER